MNILLWHVHGSWTTAFVQGKHRYLLPVTDDRGPWGRGRAQTWDWPESVREVQYERLAREQIDLIVLQRPEELELLSLWAPTAKIPKVYLEHNTPKGDVPGTRHPMADRDDVVIVHVTHFNALFWDCGATATTVIEHGIVEPAARYTGELERLAVVTNEPVRRGRVTGTDLFARFAAAAPLDVFGMGVEHLPALPGLASIGVFADPPQAAMHAELARRRAYLHLCRWTSLGLSLIEAMAIGVPVVALGTTEAVEAVPPGAGVLSTNVATLLDAALWLIESPEDARRLGAAGRAAARRRYGLDRFLADWDQLLEESLCASR
ncbi:glycosyltransferase [Dactylosporangium matsuzakiense]|uniref:Glycosyl transferase n=1 Tax=Dactylosporangium matsuzakiense TaxID=53360 RepID=A0A9W6NTI2_9ACTN|nr:glycosyltransferase [Dactylosporangium matsuzakiense]UWZ49201.1 glycosyltransferase [Dactylosporangium matsuzakiense]GLL08759.1 glycosyl transferase [Dactylosporangium matsuzakiense]